jgi:hypothetical protein
VKTIYIAHRQFMAGQRQIGEGQTVDGSVVQSFSDFNYWIAQAYLEATTVEDSVEADITGEAVTWDDPAPEPAEESPPAPARESAPTPAPTDTPAPAREDTPAPAPAPAPTPAPAPIAEDTTTTDSSASSEQE